MKIRNQIFAITLFLSTSSYAQSLFDWGKPKVAEPCYVYWNGREMKLGSTKGDDAFVRLGYSYYGVQNVVVSLPKVMEKELGISVKIGEEVKTEGNFKVFMDKHWDDVAKLCKLKL